MYYTVINNGKVYSLNLPNTEIKHSLYPHNQFLKLYPDKTITITLQKRSIVMGMFNGHVK